jgi:rhodanese-related sulfurtransferase
MDTFVYLIMRVKNHIPMFLTLCLITCCTNAVTHTESPPEKRIFATTAGLGFDKQISIWLVEKYITPENPVVFFSGDMPPLNTRLFDEAGAEFFRSADRSTFEQLAEAYEVENITTDYLKRIVFDIEINLWLPDELQDSKSVEMAFRALQEQWGRDQVPRECYKEFFNSLEMLFIEEGTLRNAGKINKELSCWSQVLKNQINIPGIMVAEMQIPVLLGHLRSGARVAFIDVREPDEFSENHIPGALNIQIRDADQAIADTLKSYDIVVAYCIKDFRGFEMAKKLKSLGITQSVILDPYGIKGWIDSKLPVYHKDRINEQQSVALLKKCLDQTSKCTSE